MLTTSSANQTGCFHRLWCCENIGIPLHIKHWKVFLISMMVGILTAVDSETAGIDRATDEEDLEEKAAVSSLP